MEYRIYILYLEKLSPFYIGYISTPIGIRDAYQKNEEFNLQGKSEKKPERVQRLLDRYVKQYVN